MTVERPGKRELLAPGRPCEARGKAAAGDVLRLGRLDVQQLRFRILRRVGFGSRRDRDCDAAAVRRPRERPHVHPAIGELTLVDPDAMVSPLLPEQVPIVLLALATLLVVRLRHRRHEGDLLAVGTPGECRDRVAVRRELHRLAATDRERPHLPGAVPVCEERNAAPVRRPAQAAFTGAIERELARGRRRIRRDAPEIRLRAVLRQDRAPHGQDRVAAVGRQRHVGDRCERRDVVEGKRPLLGLCRARQQRNERAERPSRACVRTPA